jgi:hypothetical protein
MRLSTRAKRLLSAIVVNMKRKSEYDPVEQTLFLYGQPATTTG